MPIQQGDPAPDATLFSTDGRPVSLASEWSEGPLVVLFFPLAFTSTCTAEMCTVGEDLASYTGLGAKVVGVSVDSPAALGRFREDIGVDYPFLSDFNRDAARAFGVLREEPLRPGLRGVADRSAFVIGEDGRVRYAWHTTNPGLLPPFDEIRAALGGS
jgi:glutaredoxin-dependent peroxiredoxin